MPASTKTVDEYIAAFPAPVQALLQELRCQIRVAAPEATETIAYQIPTLKLKGRNLVHFAAFTRHLGFYPTASGIDAFKDELSPYSTSRGTVRFPLDQPVPYDLVRRIVAYRVAAVTAGGR
jgi:uncharacterized protein YdhG (YjbR/CyaY superfamily)